MNKKAQSTLSNAKENSIIRQLIYYDIFDHLLSEKELVKDCSLRENTHVHFQELLDRGLIFKLNGYYAIRDENQLSEKRKKGEENTQQSMPRAMKMAKLISKFPYVRAVALSGSISKGYMDSFKDVDYFIITKPKRLWLARIMLVFYKKVFLLNSFRFFCLNYFIDENNLSIRSRNIFTATEINTLIPVYGFNLMRSFYESNEWVRDYYLDFPQKEFSEKTETPDSAFKKLLEYLLSNFVGNWLDVFSMKFTVKYWKWKYKGDKSYLFKSSFRFRRDEAKYHPGNFQELILKKFEKKWASFTNKMNEQ